MDLRPYQKKAIADLRDCYRRGRRAPLLVLPTGSGKTVTFNFMAKSAVGLGRRVLILVHRQELMRQASTSLSSMGVPHGLIAPGQYGETNNVAVASVQTLERRLKKGPLDFDFIIIDEAHHAVAGTWSRILAAFPNAKVLGVTATPIRTNGEGLGSVFDELVIGPTITELIELGYLVKPVVYAPPTDIDLTGIRRRAGDFAGGELAKRVDKPSVTGSAVEHYLKLSPGEPAIAFCASIEHATHVRDGFRSAGVASEVIHGSLDDNERDRMIKGLGSGAIKVLTSVDIISEGTDIPIVSTAILLRATESVSLYIQQVGRVLRPSASKPRALILDHVGNSLKHGLVTDSFDWSLEGTREKKSKGEAVEIVRQCKKCFAVWDEGLTCPYCGHINPPKPRKIEEREGELEEITKEKIAELRASKKAEYQSAKDWTEVIAIAKKRGDNLYSVRMKWGRKFGIK